MTRDDTTSIPTTSVFPTAFSRGRASMSFTLVELLIVISIIAILAAMLLPVLSRAKESAIRVQCMSQLRQTIIASHLYAEENEFHYPSRDQRGGYPHEIKRTTNFRYNLNPQFVKPYLGNSVMFCPGMMSLYNERDNVDANDEILKCSYQYFPWPKAPKTSFYWKVPQPYLEEPDRNDADAPIWSCVTEIEKGLVYAHGRERSANAPQGMNAARNDGSVDWVKWNDCEQFFYISWNDSNHYWPIYRE